MAREIILKIEGIDGESSLEGHEGEIDIAAWSWGATQSGGFHLGAGGGAGKVNISDLSLTKYLDLATPVLWFHCSRGTNIPEAVLTVRRAGEEPFEYLVITMTKVIVASVSIRGSEGESNGTENVTDDRDPNHGTRRKGARRRSGCHQPGFSRYQTIVSRRASSKARSGRQPRSLSILAGSMA